MKRPGLFKKILPLIILALLFAGMGAAGETPEKIVFGAPQIPDYQPLKTQLEDYVAGQPGTFGIYFMDLNSSASFDINGNEPIKAASTVKAPAVLYLNSLVAQGRLRWDDRVAYSSKQDYQEGSGILQYSARDGNTYSLRVLSNLAITISDNVAYNMLVHYLGKDTIAEFMRDMGGQTVFPNGENITTARDMGRYMKAALDFSRNNPVPGERLLDDMANPIYHVGLPGKLPPQIKVAHKEGDVWGVANDTGIVFARRPFILVVLSSGETDVDKGFARIADISRMVYDYQEKQS